MKLYPALRIKGVVVRGESDDSHNTIALKQGIDAPEDIRGFSPDGQLFLSRKQALGWLKKNDIKAFRKLPGKAHYDGLHSETLAQAYGVKQKPEAVEMRKEALSNEPKSILSGKVVTGQPKSTDGGPTDLSNKSCLVWDRGLYLFMAEKLAETFKKVYYYMPQSEPYPCSRTKSIGTGLKVERIYEFWPYLDKSDIVVFPDCYDGEMQHWLRGKGYCVFGNGRGEKLEMDKVFFLEELEKAGLPVAKTQLCEGIDDLIKYLKKQDGVRWLKTSYYRGDFETKKFVNMAQIEPWIDHLKTRIGRGVTDIEILVQDPIDSEIEVGYDGFAIDGQYTGNSITGYEIKDKGFVASISKQPAEIVQFVNDRISPIFKKLGYRGHFSTEIRVTKDGVPYFIDPTCRLPSPPSELMVEMYENYAEIIWEVANGRVPEPKPKAKYGAEVILTSESAEDMSLCVYVPKSIRPFVKLKNHMQEGDNFYCIPNGNAQFIGAVVALGDTIEEATKKVMEYVDQIKADDLHVDPNIFEKANEQIANGKKFGVKF